MPQTSSSFIGGPLTETPTSDEMTTNNAHSSMPPNTSAFSTDPGTISDTTSKNMPPLTTPTAGNLSVFIGIGVLVSIIILMGMIIVIGVIIVIIYIKKKPVRVINTGQGISHQLETTLTKGTCENNRMRILFVNVNMTCKLSDYQIL